MVSIIKNKMDVGPVDFVQSIVKLIQDVTSQTILGILDLMGTAKYVAQQLKSGEYPIYPRQRHLIGFPPEYREFLKQMMDYAVYAYAEESAPAPCGSCRRAQVLVSGKYSPAWKLLDAGENGTILAIRGTSSLADWLTDLLGKEGLDPTPFCGGVAHHGMLESARIIYNNILSTECGPNILQEGKRITIVGHSMGAGVAALLAILIKDLHPLLDVQAYCFACPPVVSFQLAREACTFVHSFIHGEDLIPVASLYNILLLFVMRWAKTATDETWGRIMEADTVSEEEWRHKIPKNPTVAPIPMYIPGNVYQLIRTTSGDQMVMLSAGIPTGMRYQIVSIDRRMPTMFAVTSVSLSDHDSLMYRAALTSALDKTPFVPPPKQGDVSMPVEPARCLSLPSSDSIANRMLHGFVRTAKAAASCAGFIGQTAKGVAKCTGIYAAAGAVARAAYASIAYFITTACLTPKDLEEIENKLKGQYGKTYDIIQARRRLLLVFMYYTLSGDGAYLSAGQPTFNYHKERTVLQNIHGVEQERTIEMARRIIELSGRLDILHEEARMLVLNCNLEGVCSIGGKCTNGDHCAAPDCILPCVAAVPWTPKDTHRLWDMQSVPTVYGTPSENCIADFSACVQHVPAEKHLRAFADLGKTIESLTESGDDVLTVRFQEADEEPPATWASRKPARSKGKETTKHGKR